MSNFENPSVDFNYSTTEKIDGTIQSLIDTGALTLASLTGAKLQHLIADIDDAENSYLRIRDDNGKIIGKLKEGIKEEITFLDKKEISTKNGKKVFLKIKTGNTTGWVSADYMKADISENKSIKKTVSKKITKKDNSEIVNDLVDYIPEIPEALYGIDISQTINNKPEVKNKNNVLTEFSPKYKKIEGEIVSGEGKIIGKDNEKKDLISVKNIYNPDKQKLLLNSRNIQVDNKINIDLSGESVIIDEIKDNEGFHLIDSEYVKVNKDFTIDVDGDIYNIKAVEVEKAKIINSSFIVVKIDDGRSFLLNKNISKGVYFSYIDTDTNGNLYFINGEEIVFEIQK